MPNTILTDIGMKKVTQAAGSQTQVALKYVALGDGNGVNYAPSFDQVSLKHERARQQIDVQHVTDQNAWRIKAAFPPDIETFDVREIGFFAEDGSLIALWAGEDVKARKTGAITYLIDHVLVFSRITEGVITVSAPDDEVFGLAVATGTALANAQLEQLTQADEIAALKAQMQAVGQ